MTDRLKNKVAIVTGGSTGIGEGIARIFATEGAKVVICSRNSDMLDAAINRIANPNVAALRCDVSDAGDVEKMVNNTIKKFGKLDILVNNAGINPHRKFTFDDLTEEEWDMYHSINAKGTFLASKYSIPYIKDSGGGSIIMITSISAFLGQENTGPYNSSKAAQEGMVRNMAMDLAKFKIRVNAIRPGWVMVERLREPREKIMDYIESLHPAGRIGYPEDIAWAAVWLASDESTWVTGSMVTVDGGYSAR